MNYRQGFSLRQILDVKITQLLNDWMVIISKKGELDHGLRSRDFDSFRNWRAAQRPSNRRRQFWNTRLLESVKDLLGPFHDFCRNSRQLRDIDAVTFICGALLYFVDKRNFVLPFSYNYIQITNSGEKIGKFR